MHAQSTPPPDGNQNKTGAIFGMLIGALVLSCVIVGLRMYTRLFILKSARWDDWTIVFALLGTAVGTGLDFPEVHYGFGRHQYYLTDHQYHEFKRYTWGEWIQTFATLMFTKVSICLLLLRIAVTQRIVRPIQGLIIFLVVSNIVLSLLWIFQCTPLDAAWDAHKREGTKCFSKGQLQRIIISQAIISIGSDFILAGFPVIILYNVRITTRQKIMLCGLMGLGLLTAACCIVRTVINWQNVHADQTWVGIDNFMWRTAEVNIGIAAACIPTLLPLYRLLHDKFIAAHQSPTSRLGRFLRFVFGQGRKMSISLQRRSWGPRKAKNSFSNPQIPHGWPPEPRRFVQLEDIEMQPRPKFNPRDNFIRGFR